MEYLRKLEKANKLFRSKHYKHALILYEELKNEREKPSSNLLFNISLCKSRKLSNLNIENPKYVKKLNSLKKINLTVLFISNTSRTERPYLDPSVRYRCFNPAVALEKFNYTSDVISYEKLTQYHINQYDIFIFHRPPFENKTKEFLQAARKKRKTIFADYDDLIFNEKYALDSSLFKSGRVDQLKCQEIFRKNAKALLLFNNFIVSTEPLKNKILELIPNGNVIVASNALGYDFMSNLSLDRNNGPRVAKEKMIITYLSGTASHDKDFEIIAEPLGDLISKHKKNIELQVIGPLNYDKTAIPEIKNYKYVEYSKLKKIISRSSINLAPLEYNEFTNCKSGLKFFESGAYYVPSVVTPISDMKRFIDCYGITYAESKNDWYTTINSLITDYKLYNIKSKKTGNYVNQHCTINNVINIYLNAFKGANA